MPCTFRPPVPAPNAYVLVITGDGTVDLTTVTAATLHVKYSDGTSESWTAATSSATATSITLTHTFTGSEAIPTALPCSAYVYPALTVPGGTLDQMAPDKITFLDHYSSQVA